MNNDRRYNDNDHPLRKAGVPDGSDDQRAQWLQKYLRLIFDKLIYVGNSGFVKGKSM
jgi:hypothetical protein